MSARYKNMIQRGSIVVCSIAISTSCGNVDFDEACTRRDSHSGNVFPTNATTTSTAEQSSEVRVAHAPIVRYVDPTEEHKEWAIRTYILPDNDYGYERFAFVEVETDVLVTLIRASPAYMGNSTGREPALENAYPNVEPDFWLELFELQYPMVVTKAYSVTRFETEFVNAHGRYFPIRGHPFSDIPGPTSWSIFIDVKHGWVTMVIKTSTHSVIMQQTRDYLATIIAIVSNLEKMKFPPIY